MTTTLQMSKSVTADVNATDEAATTMPPDKIVYLNAQRVRRYFGIDEAVTRFIKMVENPTLSRRLTKRLCVTLTENSPNFNWQHIAYNVLTDEGYAEFERRIQGVNNLSTAKSMLQVAKIDARKARHYVNWLTKYADDAPSFTDAQLDELKVAYAKFNEDTKKAVNIADVNKLDLFIELSRRYARDELQVKPKSRKFNEGEVLITEQTLRQLGSCEPYLIKFRERFPEGTVITEQICVEHHDAFDWYWAAERMLHNAYEDWYRVVNSGEVDADPTVTDAQTKIRELDELYTRRADELGRMLSDGLISRDQRDRKLTELANQRNEFQWTRDAAVTIFRARTFAKLYAKQPKPGLANIAF